jgi:hypothetical protein
VLPELTQAYDSEDATTRRFVLEALTEVGPPASAAVPTLVRAVREDPTTTLRQQAARALGAIGMVTSEVVDVLVAAAEGEVNAANREEAIRALATLRPAAGTETSVLVSALARSLSEDRIYSVRAAAADALGAVGPAALEAGAAPALLIALEDGMPAVRNAAADALAALGPGARSLLPELERIALEHEKPATARAARRAIEGITAVPSAEGVARGLEMEHRLPGKPPLRRADRAAGAGPAPIEETVVEFALETKPGTAENVYSTADARLFAFVTRPEGDRIEGDDLQGIVQATDVFYLDPSKYAPGRYEFRYRGESLVVTIVDGTEEEPERGSPLPWGAGPSLEGRKPIALPHDFEIEEEKLVEFTLERREGLPEYVYCTTDDGPFRFTARPEGSAIEGNALQGVRYGREGYFLVPRYYAPGEYTFSYHGRNLRIRILAGGAEASCR